MFITSVMLYVDIDTLKTCRVGPPQPYNEAHFENTPAICLVGEHLLFSMHRKRIILPIIRYLPHYSSDAADHFS